MKIISCFVALLLTVILVRAQAPPPPADPVTHEVTYSEEVRVAGSNGREIYDKIKPFVYEQLEPVKYVRFWGDENTLRIYVHGGFIYDYTDPQNGVPLYVYFDLMVECHDGYYTYTFNHFTYDVVGTSYWVVEAETPGMTKKQKRQMRRERKTRWLIDGFVRKNVVRMKQLI